MKGYMCFRRLISLVLFAFVLFPCFSYSQETKQIVELEKAITSLKNSSEPKLQTEADKLSGLAYDIKPTLYYTNKQQTQTGKSSPVRVIADLSTVTELYKTNVLFKDVEFICIKIENKNDLRSVLQLSKLDEFSNLKYIYFLCSFEICPGKEKGNNCELEMISRLIQDAGNSDIKILYTAALNE